MDYKYDYIIIDTLTNEETFNLQDQDEAWLTLEFLNSGLAESGLYPSYKMVILPRILIAKTL